MHLEPSLLIMAAMVYLVVAIVFLNSSQLFGVYKWLFSLTFLPVFLLLMYGNIWVADHLFPNIIEWQQNLTGRGGSNVAFLITAVVPVTVCWLWYALFVRLSNRSRKSLNMR